jgi:hypothetical protein
MTYPKIRDIKTLGYLISFSVDQFTAAWRPHYPSTLNLQWDDKKLAGLDVPHADRVGSPT